ncbi:MAG: ABC transporter ATP-binding protein [Planctomycetota bacterium]|jgi:branched-chain amino acid transport system ATP-binding protein|nr:ABC transporter ATP-binding protein [Planctomycetota bacterium]
MNPDTIQSGAGARAQEALRIENVSKSFGGVRAVNAATMSLAPGERRSLIGPNGAGKTTLFNLVTGSLPADSGRVVLFGEDITGYSVARRALLGMGRSYQISKLLLDLTVEENIMLSALGGENMFSGMLSSWRRKEDKVRRVREIAREVGLVDVLRVKVGELSHGQQRQLELGVILAMRLRIILLDEPAAGLSPSEREVIKDLLNALPNDVTILLIEHDMDVVLNFSDRITVLHQGAIYVEGTPDEIRANEQVQKIYLGTLYE